MTNHPTNTGPLRPAWPSDGPPILGSDDAASRATAGLLGQVMSLVALTIGFLWLGTLLGRDLSPGAALGWTFGGFGMLLVQSFGGARFRVGPLATGWLFAVGVVIGVGLGPVITYYAEADPSAVAQAAGATALIVAAMGAAGLLVDRDLASWLRPLTFAVLVIVVVALVLALVGEGGNPLISLAIGGVSAVLVLVDFNYLRRHGTDDDVVLLATGIFVSVVNIFLSLLNLFSSE